MKKLIKKIILGLVIFTAVGMAFAPAQAHAMSIWGLIFCPIVGNTACNAAGTIGSDIIFSLLSSLSYAVLTIAGFFLSLTGALLNVSIILTMNIKAIYEATPAIDQVWIVMRNLSSMFIIFTLLYTSIATILDFGKTNVKELVGKIIMVGLLINFSLFFTKVAIDASNLISLQFYRAIVPNSQNATLDSKHIGDVLLSSFTTGGISDVFKYNLKIDRVYDSVNQKALLDTSGGGDYFKLFIATLIGSTIMIIASFSFLTASFAFIIRLVILLLLMGFSPLYFAGMIFPEIEKAVSDKWFNWLKQQLIFMPVYLLFTYVALSFISTINSAGDVTGFFSQISTASTNAGAAGNTSSTVSLILSYVGILIQYTIALILIMVPLIAASQTGGSAVSWAKSATKWVNGKVKSGAGTTWKYTGGAAAAKIAESEGLKKSASKDFVYAGVLKGMRGVAKSYNETTKKDSEERAKFGESLGYDKQEVYKHENGIIDLKNRIDDNEKIIYDTNSTDAQVAAAKNFKKRYQAGIKKHELEIAEEKRKRQIDYANRLDPRDIDEDTGKLKPISLWDGFKKKGKGYVAKYESLASSQIHIKNTESDIEQLKNELTDKKKEQDKIKSGIDRIDEQEIRGNVKKGDPQDLKRIELKKDLKKLLDGDPSLNIKGLLELGKEIREKEQEVKIYKGLS